MSYPQYQDPYQDPHPTPYQEPLPTLYQDPYGGGQWSDKSKIVAGLLQILPGFFLGLGGIGRLYAGHTAIGVVQLIATVFGWICFWCGFLLVVPFFVFAAGWIWFVIDGVILLAGRPVDGQGRLLRG